MFVSVLSRRAEIVCAAIGLMFSLSGCAGTGLANQSSRNAATDASRMSSDTSTSHSLKPEKPAADPCVAAGTCPLGTWINITPESVDVMGELSCENYGTESVQADPLHPGTFYTLFMCQGIWKTTDYGTSWSLVSTGKQGSVVGDCAGGLSVTRNETTNGPTLYVSCIRGAGTGFWKSVNGGVDWTRHNVGPGGERQDFYPAAIDPYNPDHLIMAGHEMNLLVESVDGGQTWTEVHADPGMKQSSGTAALFFIDTGRAETSAKTFLWLAQYSDKIGTWRTSDGGVSWKNVDKNEHPHGLSQIFQPDTKGTVFMAGAYSALGSGVLRSTDYGVTWAHVGEMSDKGTVFGTSKNVYAMSSAAVSPGTFLDPTFEMSPQPATGSWTTPGTPAAMTVGAAAASIVNDGQHNVILTANFGAGLWRYVEP